MYYYYTYMPQRAKHVLLTLVLLSIRSTTEQFYYVHQLVACQSASYKKDLDVLEMLNAVTPH